MMDTFYELISIKSFSIYSSLPLHSQSKHGVFWYRFPSVVHNKYQSFIYQIVNIHTRTFSGFVSMNTVNMGC